MASDERFLNKLHLLYENVQEIADNFVVVKNSEGLMCICKVGDNAVKSEVFDNWVPFDIEGMLQAVKDGNYGIIGDKANVVVPIKFTKIVGANKKIILAERKNLIAVYNLDGKEIIKSGNHKFAGAFQNNYGEYAIIIHTNGKKQYVLNHRGEVVLDEDVVDNRYYTVIGHYIIRSHSVHYSKTDTSYEGDTKPKIYDFHGKLIEEFIGAFVPPIKNNQCRVEIKGQSSKLLGEVARTTKYVGRQM